MTQTTDPDTLTSPSGSPVGAVDAVLVGGGIMSATLAALLGMVAPHWSVAVFEAADGVGQESSGPWNNAGTGHSALCELNYTPAGKDGTVDPAKAVGINEEFQVSRQLWSSLVRRGLTDSPRSFITSVPHISFVTGAQGQAYMQARHAALAAQPLFAEMEFTKDASTLSGWVPLMMEGRRAGEPVAATRSIAGTDVNFGALTSLLLADAQRRGVHLQTSTRVRRVERDGTGRWRVTVQRAGEGPKVVHTPFVFVGAGGGALSLLQHSGIPEIRGFGGFPVSGQFLRTSNPALVARHQAKVYGQAKIGAPPMSVPHLDLRLIDGAQSLLFGPYAGFSPKFLKAGSFLDLPRSVRPDNLGSMLGVARTNVALTRYLIGQVVQSRADRITALSDFVPTADGSDWDLITAGQRVQVIRRGANGKGGVLQFGTELITSADGSIGGLLGASPGASTAASAMLTLLERCFPGRIDAWRPVLAEAIPSYGRRLSADPVFARELKEETAKTLELVA